MMHCGLDWCPDRRELRCHGCAADVRTNMRMETTLPPLAQPPKAKPPEVDLTCGAGAELKRVREALRMTQLEIATAVGMERTSITNIERGKQKLSLVLLKAIADALGMEVVVHLRPKATDGVSAPSAEAQPQRNEGAK